MSQLKVTWAGSDAKKQRTVRVVDMELHAVATDECGSTWLRIYGGAIRIREQDVHFWGVDDLANNKATAVIEPNTTIEIIVRE